MTIKAWVKEREPLVDNSWGHSKTLIFLAIFRGGMLTWLEGIHLRSSSLPTTAPSAAAVTRVESLRFLPSPSASLLSTSSISRAIPGSLNTCRRNVTNHHHRHHQQNRFRWCATLVWCKAMQHVPHSPVIW